ncbi:MAG: hypothetical protein ABQ298_10820 [Puniceicoccaceae bacterium]
MKVRRTIRILAMSLLPLLLLCVVLLWHQVDLSLSPEDKTIFSELFPAASAETRSELMTFAHELAIIRSVQQTALHSSPIWEGIALNSRREPADLVQQGRGICYDRSRFIEKALRYHGFEVRHVALYEKIAGSALKSLLRPKIASHAASEVRTSEGWLYVDSNQQWIALCKDGMPVSVRQIAKQGLQTWVADPSEAPDILKEDFVYIFGLYSRHGRFYPPYNPIPDVAYSELWMNLGLFE